MAAYLEKYVSSLATDGVGDGTEGNPWSWNDAVTAAANGFRMNVKADGTYTLAPNSGSTTIHYWTKGASDMGTPDAPVCWRGYTTTPGDGGIVSVSMASDKQLVTYPAVSGLAQRGCWVAQNFRFQWSSNASTRGIVDTGNIANSRPMFVNCYFSNTFQNAGSANPGLAMGGGGAVFIQCSFVSQQVNPSYPTIAIISAASGANTYYGCKFSGPRYVSFAGPGAPELYLQCVFNGGGVTPAFRRACASEGDSTFFLHCVFDNYSNILDCYRATSGSVGVLSLLNCVFRDISGAVIIDPAEASARHYLVGGNKIWNSSGTYADLFQLHTLSDHYDSNEMWPFGTVDILTSDPFEDAAHGDYRLNDTVGGGACKAIGFPGRLFDDGVTTPEPFARDVGVYQSLPEIDYPIAQNVRDGVTYGNGLYEGTLELPAVADVRHGTTFDAVAVEKTGTCHVPIPGDVRQGVSVDHTVGTLEVVPRDLTFEDQS